MVDEKILFWPNQRGFAIICFYTFWPNCSVVRTEVPFYASTLYRIIRKMVNNDVSMCFLAGLAKTWKLDAHSCRGFTFFADR